ncbi:MAG: branched-chain amino acid ABC transporter permease [Myxococcales bacterium]|nr:branched-chain amino acid ABC transporter permease [Myxococcales bacterium]
MDLFVQLTVTGLTNGAILSLAALGFVLIYKSSDVLNFAQGEFLLLGAYFAYAAIVQGGLPWPVGMAITVGCAVAMGLVVERLVLRPMVGEPVISLIMVTIGLASVLRAIVGLIWGTQPRPFPAFIPSEPVTIGAATVGSDRLWAIVVAGVLLAGFTLFFRLTRQGIAMRAVADDQQAAMSMGISVNRVFGWAWAIGAVSAALGGAILANIVGVGPELGHFGLYVFPVVIVGGLDSIPGAVVGGLIIGLLQAYTRGYVGDGLDQVLPYIVLVGILLVRPYGLFGEQRVERV